MSLNQIEAQRYKKNRPTRNESGGIGVSAGIRTQDPILQRDVLYLLSYWDNRLFPKRLQKYTFF